MLDLSLVILQQASNAVNQGCVLAPTLFSLYFSTMLEVAFKDGSERVYIQTKTSKLVRDLLFADDSTLVAHDSDDIQNLVDRFADVARMFRLTDKT